MIKALVRTALLVMLLLAVGVGWHAWSFLGRAVGPETPRVITISAGAPFGKVADDLAREGVVADPDLLRLLSRWRGDARKIQAGEYEFGAPATPGQILDRLVTGDVRRYRLVIPEGYSLREIASTLELAGLGEAGRFLRLTHDPEFVRSFGLEAPSLEGYLFPETYTYSAGMPQEALIQAMVRQFQLRLSPEIVAAARDLGLDRHQLVTLASIIQKEAGNLQEMPIISAVFHNRLRRGMRLQADPTVIYGVEDYAGRITRRHLNTPTPYNTYQIRGLPPGPIASPGLEALHAAANPAPVNYLYFVSRGDGTHVFSETLREHNEAVRRYILRRPDR